MSEAPAALHALIDVGLGGVLLANMLAGWLDNNPEVLSSVEAGDESRDQRTTPEQDAYVYVRQSTLAQVRHHQESTERQYALRQKALELGWSDPAIRPSTGTWECRGPR